LTAAATWITSIPLSTVMLRNEGVSTAWALQQAALPATHMTLLLSGMHKMMHLNMHLPSAQGMRTCGARLFC
jgi:hypothetical protein